MAFWNEYFPQQLCKSVMSCEGHDRTATKSSSCVNKLFIWLFVISMGNNLIETFNGIKTEKRKAILLHLKYFLIASNEP